MNPTVVLSTAVAVATAAYVFKPKKKTELEAKSVPIPEPKSYLPLQIDGVVGYIYNMWKGEDELEMLLKDMKKYGNTINFRGFNDNFIIVTDPSSIQHILAKNQPNYEKGTFPHSLFCLSPFLQLRRNPILTHTCSNISSYDT
jgi:hypothetical protein